MALLCFSRVAVIALFKTSSFQVTARSMPKKLSSKVKPNSTISEAIQTVKENLNAMKHRRTTIFLGTGQYFHHKTNERVVALALAEEQTMQHPLELLDAEIHIDEIDKLKHEIVELPECLSLASGEVDTVHDTPWSFAYTTKPEFTVFSKDGYNLLLQCLKEGFAFRVFNGPLSEDINFNDILHVQLTLSADPWEERKVELKLKNNELLTVIEDFRGKGSCDLGELMISTEWMVKMAGYMCLKARQLGGCQHVSLKLPAELRADGNPWIEMRNKAWSERVQHKGDS